ncbi:MAG: hypothetical protein OXE55_07455 [Flavobacteriaceae bacterium]|nr:hypothetical protein [Flavobacteriaceae bacterium]
MKRIFILLAAVAVVAAGCKNYDDRFDNLNDQIKTLTTQVTTLQGVASQVTALNTEIGNIRTSIQGDIKTAVDGVSVALGTNLTNAQTAINEDIAKLQTALTQAAANSLSQADIKKLQDDLDAKLDEKIGTLQTALSQALDQEDIDNLKKELASTQKVALDTALKSLQDKLAELEKALATASSGALSQANLDKLQGEIKAQLAAIKKELTDELGDGGFHVGDITITSSREWDNTKRRQADNTEFSGDITINTAKLEAAEVDELIGWVANITVINGDLTITHAGEEKVVKFAQLESVGDLDDSQLHAHYPELASAGTITLDGDIKTVKLPKLTTLEGFADDQIVLSKGEDLTLSALASYDADLRIDLGGTVAVIDLSALKVLDDNGDEKDGEADLTIDGPDEVSLPELTTLRLLHVKDVRRVTAPKVKGADLQIGEDVVSVHVGTEEKAHINDLHVDDADDLEILQIGGNPGATNKGGTVVALNTNTTPDLERAHIHGGFSLTVGNLDDLEELLTARTIASAVVIKNTGLKGELVLDHESGANGDLTVEYNDDIESLKADKVNKLSRLYIKGNHDLGSISLAALKEAGTQKTRDPWYNSDGIAIGAEGYGTHDANDRNNLIADEIRPELKTNNKVDRAGKIVDDSAGLKGLKEFLGHSNVKLAVVSYDGAEKFQPDKEDTSVTEIENTETEANRNHLILFRKGTADIKGTKAVAKRVFLVDTDRDDNDPFPVDSPTEDLRIGVGGGDFNPFRLPIDLSANGSVANWAAEINKAEVKSFFDTNNIEIQAEVGGHPTGSLTFNSIGGDNDPDPGHDDELDDTAVGTITLTIGKGSSAYSNKVTLVDVDSDNPKPADKAFSATNKKAETYLNVNNSNQRTVTAIAKALIEAFPIYNEGSNADRGPAAHVPYGINDLTTVKSVPNVALIGVLDAKRITANIDVKIDNQIKATEDAKKPVAFLNPKGGESAEIRQLNIKNDPNTIQITLTSKVAGEDESTIGQPVVEPSTDRGSDGNDDVDFVLPNSNSATTPGAYVYVGDSWGPNSVELPIAKTNPRASSLPKAGTDDAGAQTRGGAEFDRLGWL